MMTYYVDADTGNDANDGLAWGTAKEHIQAAIDLIVAPITGKRQVGDVEIRSYRPHKMEEK